MSNVTSVVVAAVQEERCDRTVKVSRTRTALDVTGRLADDVRCPMSTNSASARTTRYTTFVRRLSIVHFESRNLECIMSENQTRMATLRQIYFIFDLIEVCVLWI